MLKINGYEFDIKEASINITPLFYEGEEICKSAYIYIEFQGKIINNKIRGGSFSFTINNIALDEKNEIILRKYENNEENEKEIYKKTNHELERIEAICLDADKASNILEIDNLWNADIFDSKTSVNFIKKEENEYIINYLTEFKIEEITPYEDKIKIEFKDYLTYSK
ncbi:MAG: hypothetical protein IKF91_04315 [Bacilli bacterium]|nr:hypothetical protein [Bacilli bacterium]